MRIAFVYDALYPWVKGGAERRFHEVATRLATDHDVHHVSWQWWDGASTIERDGMTLHGVGAAPTLYGGDGKRTVREAVAFSARLLPVLMRNRFDVIDCSATPYLPLYPTALAARLTGARLVATWHEFWGEHWAEYLPHRPIVARAARMLEGGARRLGDRVVTVSAFTAEAMGMADDPRVEVVGNGVDVASLTRRTTARERTDLVFVGRLIDEKRVDLLIDAVAALRGRFPDLTCTIVGDGPERATLERRAAAAAVDDRITFTGAVESDALPRHLKAARILVMPSVREGYGMAVAEAQAAGVVPVVVRAPFSAASELVRDGRDGIIAEPTVDGLADAIGSLLDDGDRVVRMARAARTVGRARDWDVVAARMAETYERTATTPRAMPVRSVPWS